MVPPARYLAPLSVLALGAVTTLARADEPSPSPPASAPGAPAAATDAPASSTPPAPPAVDAPPPVSPAPPSKPKPPPYSLPWQLRPAVAVNAIRSDTSVAFYDGAYPGSPSRNSGTTFVTTLLFSYKVMDGPSGALAPLVRVGVVSDSPPNTPFGIDPSAKPPSAAAFLNPVVGALYSMKLGDFRFAPFLGLALPLGGGGGDDPDAGALRSRTAGVFGRMAMDNAMFAANDLVIFPGVGFAWVKGGATLQVEATILSLTRVRGGGARSPTNPVPWQPEAQKWNFTTGFHAGYFLAPEVSIAAELRYQRWLNPPFAVDDSCAGQNPLCTPDSAGMDNLSAAVGPRFHINLGDGMWLRPGIAYARGIDRPMREPGGRYTGLNNVNMVQLDVPFVF